MSSPTANVARIDGAGRVDRNRPLAFTFNGRKLQGYAGDTLASALLANGIHLVGRSYKYHRPRGIFSAGNEEPNAVVQLEHGARTEPNLQATGIELYDANTGEYLGRSNRVKCDLAQTGWTKKVNDLLILYDGTSFIGVKMNLMRDWSGKLVKNHEALSRSLFARMIPAGYEAAFFGIYEVSERGTSWMGPQLFGIVVARTGSYREAILSVIVLFIAGAIILALTDTARAIREARTV